MLSMLLLCLPFCCFCIYRIFWQEEKSYDVIIPAQFTCLWVVVLVLQQIFVLFSGSCIQHPPVTLISKGLYIQLSLCCEGPALTSIEKAGEDWWFMKSDLHREADGAAFLDTDTSCHCVCFTNLCFFYFFCEAVALSHKRPNILIVLFWCLSTHSDSALDTFYDGAVSFWSSFLQFPINLTPQGATI